MVKVFWPESVLEVFFELPEREREINLEKITRLVPFPRLYPVRTKGRYRGHRWFLAHQWIVYYRVQQDNVYIRGLWPARIP